MPDKVILDYEEYEYLKDCRNKLEAMRERIPAHHIKVYGFIGEDAEIFIMKSFKDFQKHMERYAEIQATKYEYDIVEDELKHIKEEVVRLKRGFFFNLFYGNKI